MVVYRIYGVAEWLIALEFRSHARISNDGLARVRYTLDLARRHLLGTLSGKDKSDNRRSRSGGLGKRPDLVLQRRD